MAESQFARDMRREAEAQTAFAEDTHVAQLEAGRQGVELAHRAVYAAERAEELAEDTFGAQVAQNRRTAAHEFAMWRQRRCKACDEPLASLSRPAIRR